VQAFPSLQDVPFGFAGFEHVPFAGSHVPASWHVSLGVHITGFDPVQAPAWQLSVRVHAFPSLQAVPFGFAGFEQVPFVGLQVPASWHVSLGVHVTGFEPVQVPFWQVSVRVHAFPSLHVVPLLAFELTQAPTFGSQTATWHESDGVQVLESHGCAIRHTLSS